ncbi:hypothetical protein LAWI1_G000087, partial [Lachnellula willkommii]
MCSARLEIPNCKVKVRSYVLVQNPSRWKMKGERVTVHSPVRNLSTTLQEIPVKRYCQDEEQNSYEIGDPFWINVGPKTKNYTTSVPVINLRTLESGSIAVGH